MRSTANANKSAIQNIFTSIAQNDIEQVQQYLNDPSLNIDVVDDGGDTPFMAAVRRGHLQIVQAFLTKNLSVIHQVKENGATPLYIASENGHLDVVKALLANGAAVNQAYKNGTTPLIIASYDGRLEIVKALLEKGADVNQALENGITPLYIASQEGHLDVVKVLLANDADVDRALEDGATPLYIASQEGHLDVVEVLLEKGAKVNQAKASGATPLYIASQRGHLDVVEVLLANDADTTKTYKGFIPLSVVLKKQHEVVVSCLLEYELNWLLRVDVSELTDARAKELKPHKKQLFEMIKKRPNAKEIMHKIFDLSQPDKKNMKTAIGKFMWQGGAHVGIFSRHTQLGAIYKECEELGWLESAKKPDDLKIVKLSDDDFFKAIYENDCGQMAQCINNNPSVVDRAQEGKMPLAFASLHGCLPAVCMLLAANADVKQRVQGDETPLYYAVQSGHASVVLALLNAGADANQTSSKGMTLFSMAVESKHEDVINCMLEAKLKWLLQAEADDVTDEMAKELKPFRKQLFDIVKRLPYPRIAAQMMFDPSKDDKKNMTTALGKVMCQGRSGVGMLKATTKLNGFYNECIALNFFGKTPANVKEIEKSEGLGEVLLMDGFSIYGNDRL